MPGGPINFQSFRKAHTRIQGRPALLIGILAVLVSGCEASILWPSSSGAATSVPGMFETIVAASAAAAQSQTATVIPPTPTPSWTPLPTHTPSLTPTLTPTFHFSLGASRTPTRPPTSVSPATATHTASESDAPAGCVLLSQSPEDGSHFDPKKNFAASWKVKNTGASTWDTDSVDFVYDSGAKMHKKQLYDLPTAIPVGQYVTLNVTMLAPKSDGTYTTVWSLRRGTTYFCHVDLTIRVP
jgi:hypothetical protein